MRNQVFTDAFATIDFKMPQAKPSHLLKEAGFMSLWYLCAVENLDSILKNGILSKHSLESLALNSVDISDQVVQAYRERVEDVYCKSVHDYAPSYINPLSPMQYSRKELTDRLCLLEIDVAVMDDCDSVVTNGNAACRNTRFFEAAEGVKHLPVAVLKADYWSGFVDGRCKRSAEVLIPNCIDSSWIKCVHVKTAKLTSDLQQQGIKAMYNPTVFF